VSAGLTEFFFALTPERVLDAIELEGSRCTGRFIVLNSYENRVYQLELDDDSYVVAKFYRPGRWSDDAILDEHDFLLDLHELEIPVTPPRLLSDGETLGEVEGIRFSVCQRIGGRAPDEMDDEQLRQFGRTLARIHGVGRQAEAEDRIDLDPDTLLGDNLQFLLEHDLLPPAIRAAYEHAVVALIELVNPMFDGLEFQRIHGDCHLGNLLRTPSGLVFLDFDDMAMGPPVQDLWLMVGGRDPWAERRQDLILEGYETMGHFDRASLRLVEPLRAMRYVHYATWLARRWQDPAFKIGFPGFGTEQWWVQALRDVQEQLELVREGGPQFGT
jgi:Ser/Thr protein kinase RdoA (MazF antagonist)